MCVFNDGLEMDIARIQVDVDLGALLRNNPFAAPTGDACFIKKLPPELLSCVFEAGFQCWFKVDCEDDNEDDAGDSGPVHPVSRIPFGIVASHVCRHWRNVALSTPSLWTTIVVAPQARPPYERVSVMLARSKALPLDIFVDEPDEDDHDVEPPSSDDIRFLCSILIPHIQRWRVVDISVLAHPLMYEFLRAVSDPSIPAASQLTMLALFGEDSTKFSYPTMSTHFTLFSGSAPLLTSVVLWGVHVDWDQPWISSAPNLIDLDLEFHAEDVRPSWPQFATILRGASALRKLSLNRSSPSGGPEEWFIEPTPASPTDLNAPIALVQLRDLIFMSLPEDRVIGLLRRLYLPALKHLELDFDDGNYSNFVRELAGPATSLFPTQEQQSLVSQLESLDITGLPCEREDIEMFFGELRNLVSLRICMSSTNGFMQVLSSACTLPGRGGVWLPRFATLYVKGSQTSPNIIRTVVQKRRNVGVPLTSLYVEVSCKIDMEDVEWLEQNADTFQAFLD